MLREDWDKLVEQLRSLPGGAEAAMPDFFGAFLDDGLAPITSEWDFEGWLLKDGNVLSLRFNDAVDGMQLVHVAPDDEVRIARAGRELLDAARQGGVSPLLLMLLAIAAGQVEDGKRLKGAAAKIDGAAKDLMLMTVCRLCG
jgi:hypothetical protein